MECTLFGLGWASYQREKMFQNKQKHALGTCWQVLKPNGSFLRVTVQEKSQLL